MATHDSPHTERNQPTATRNGLRSRQGGVHSLFVRREAQLTWRETVRRFSYYSLGIAALWALAIFLFFISHTNPR
jgi:hypothetical protein